jgi:hypothetical protein
MERRGVKLVDLDYKIVWEICVRRALISHMWAIDKPFLFLPFLN